MFDRIGSGKYSVKRERAGIRHGTSKHHSSRLTDVKGEEEEGGLDRKALRL